MPALQLSDTRCDIYMGHIARSVLICVSGNISCCLVSIALACATIEIDGTCMAMPVFFYCGMALVAQGD